MKILMLSDALEVGGAETHIETLALALVNRGCKVSVASAGGEVAQRLKKSGIQMLSIPDVRKKQTSQAPYPPKPREKHSSQTISPSTAQGKKALLSLPLSLKCLLARELIRRYIDREHPDVVHAHTRRMAFLAFRICKMRKIPLVTTAHAMFSMKFPKNLLSKWGDGTIAVSEDIKHHLISCGAVREDQIKVIPNGVKIKNERLSRPVVAKNSSTYPSNPHKIVFVSRLDEDCSLGAYLLCEIAQKLAQKYTDLRITIVGGGSEYPKIAEIASQANQKVNHKLINSVGSAKDPSVFFADCSLFIGVSRAALEAMAHELPVILLGNEGYLGLLDETKLTLAKKTNFTCRSFAATNNTPTKSVSSNFAKAVRGRCTGTPTHTIFSPDALFNEICRYFELPDKEKARLSALSRTLVEQNYSEEKMTRETLDFYRNTAKKYGKGLF